MYTHISFLHLTMQHRNIFHKQYDLISYMQKCTIIFLTLNTYYLIPGGLPLLFWIYIVLKFYMNLFFNFGPGLLPIFEFWGNCIHHFLNFGPGGIVPWWTQAVDVLLARFQASAAIGCHFRSSGLLHSVGRLPTFRYRVSIASTMVPRNYKSYRWYRGCQH